VEEVRTFRKGDLKLECAGVGDVRRGFERDVPRYGLSFGNNAIEHGADRLDGGLVPLR
jgi:hypothetical protein